MVHDYQNNPIFIRIQFLEHFNSHCIVAKWFSILGGLHGVTDLHLSGSVIFKFWQSSGMFLPLAWDIFRSITSQCGRPQECFYQFRWVRHSCFLSLGGLQGYWLIYFIFCYFLKSVAKPQINWPSRKISRGLGVWGVTPGKVFHILLKKNYIKTIFGAGWMRYFGVLFLCL